MATPPSGGGAAQGSTSCSFTLATTRWHRPVCIPRALPYLDTSPQCNPNTKGHNPRSGAGVLTEIPFGCFLEGRKYRC